MSWRDLHCGELRPEHIGTRMTVAGWTDTRRDHGGLVFIDLRDHTGQAAARDQPGARAPRRRRSRTRSATSSSSRRRARSSPARPRRSTRTCRPARSRSRSTRVAILSRSTPLPFQLDEENVDETLRLRYRWLDLRRDRMQRNFRLSHTVIAAIRRTMDDLGFIDVWTPSMTRGTPEGARDFLVPVRLQPGRFFALAQSPQLFKQLCMVGGIDRYYQIATCWRDEDLRADRQFEFRQLDLELAFVEREDVLDVLEAASSRRSRRSVARRPRAPFPRLAYDDVIARYGTDKPDLRFGLEIQDATEVTRGSEFGVFASAPCVRFLVAPRAFSRAELARLEEVAKEWGAKGLAYIVVDESGEVRSPIAKFLSERELARVRGAARLDRAVRRRRPRTSVARVLGGLRAAPRPRARARRTADADVFHWVIDFPLFERDDDGRWTFLHHPFTAPMRGRRGVGRSRTRRASRASTTT